MTDRHETFISFDVEADGRVPGVSSMWSFGAAAFADTAAPSSPPFATYGAVLEELPDANGEPDTLNRWSKQPDEIYRANRDGARDPADVMREFVQWLDVLAIRTDLVPVAYPAGFDWTYLYWYMIKFVGRSPFGFQCLDIESQAMSLLGTRWKDTVKRHMPSSWFPEQRHTHVPLEDAIEQGQLFLAVRQHAGVLRERAAALEELVAVKRLKENHGETVEYGERQPAAWARAKAAVA